MTRRAKVLLAIAVAATIVLVGVGVLATSGMTRGRPGRLPGSETSSGTARSAEATPLAPSDESTASRASTLAAEVPAADTGAPVASPVFAARPLARVEGVPARTLAFVKLTAADAGDAYTVEFAPYGYGPGGKGHSLVVRISRSTPVGTPAKPFQLDGCNVLLDASNLKVEQVVELGGSYTGTLVFVLKGRTLIPELRDAHRNL